VPDLGSNGQTGQDKSLELPEAQFRGIMAQTHQATESSGIMAQAHQAMESST
jgi:hypothetical protein